MVSKEEHEREQRALWDALVVATVQSGRAITYEALLQFDETLAERDKRFPAPEESGEK